MGRLRARNAGGGCCRPETYRLPLPTFESGDAWSGLTTRSVSDRIAELNSATGVPSPFKVEAYFESSDPPAHERANHRHLASCRVPGKEFFRASLEDALRAARIVTGGEPLGVPKIHKSYRADPVVRKLYLRTDIYGTYGTWRKFFCSGCAKAFNSAGDKCPYCGSAGLRF